MCVSPIDSPLCAVRVAGLALACPVGVFPDHRVSVSLHTVGAARYAVGAIFKVRALGTLVRMLQVGTEEG